jgi:hypothetical protein
MADSAVRVICWLMIAIFPASLLAADSNAAMLYAQGTAWINGNAVPRSSALFPGDMVQTKPDSVVSINALGSKVTILADSLVKFEGKALSVEHGGVSVATSKGWTTRAGEVTIAPASSSWTEFEVRDVDGTVQIMARKGDVTVSDSTGTNTLSQGDQTTRDETQDESQKKKKKRRKAGGALPAGSGGILDSPWAIVGGAALGGGVLLWVLLQDGDPISPERPN